MTTLSFTLSPIGCARLHDALVCLSRFDEYVKLEAQSRFLVLAALNSSKTAHVAFYLDRNNFFESFELDTLRNEGYAFQILNKALLVIFRSKLVDSKGSHSTLEKCEVRLEESNDRAACRLVIKMLCGQGVTKTYRLTYEPIKMLHALFSSSHVSNRWRAQSSCLKDYLDLFAPRTELLDICSQGDRLTLVSYTEKVTNGREILKQPLETTVMINHEDFEQVEVEDDVHIKISVKDFKNMVLNADTFRTAVTAQYSQPGRPLQFSYIAEGVRSEFTLMTISDGRSSLTPAVSRAGTREPSARGSQAPSIRNARAGTSMAPPPLPRRQLSENSRGGSQLGSRVNGSAFRSMSSGDDDDQGMFVPDDDDDAQWAPANGQEVLGWDASGKQDTQPRGTFRDIQPRIPFPDLRRNNGEVQDEEGLGPTQRASEVHGLFD